jgi:hypothetical protein
MLGRMRDWLCFCDYSFVCVFVGEERNSSELEGKSWHQERGTRELGFIYCYADQ